MSTPRPLGDRVLVRQDVAPDKIGSFYVPDVASKEYPPFGTVVATGPKVTDECPGPGARVLFKRRPGSALIQDSRLPDQNPEWQDLVMLLEEDILAEVLP